MAFVASRVAGVPEGWRAALIQRRLEHAGFFAIPDFPDGVAAKLEIETPLVDRKTVHALEVKPLLDVADQLAQVSNDDLIMASKEWSS